MSWRTARRFAGRAACAVAVLAAAAAAGPAASLAAGRAVTPADWPAFLDGPAHDSYASGQTSIQPGNVGSLRQMWHFVGDKPTMPGQPAPAYNSSPTVADGAVFIGSRSGWFYKLDESSGAVLAKRFLGFQPGRTCTAGGFVGTATVAPDPSTGQDTVYVGAPDGYLYALRASNLSVKWRSVIAIPSHKVSDYFQWSSPTVSNGRIYIGVSAHCDVTPVRGGVFGYRQATGKLFARFYVVPRGVTGGSVWSSVAAGGRYVYVSTGNADPGARRAYYTQSIVKLRAATLAPVASFIVPRGDRTADDDFGASPALFSGLVGACNKNGIFYALAVPSLRRAWQLRVAASAGATNQCNASAVYGGKYLYLAARTTTIGGKNYNGAVREVNALTGKVIWQTGLPNGVIGTPTLNGGGVLAVGTYGSSATPDVVYLINAKTGQIMQSLNTGGGATFAQSVFANGWIFAANGTGVYAFGP